MFQIDQVVTTKDKKGCGDSSFKMYNLCVCACTCLKVLELLLQPLLSYLYSLIATQLLNQEALLG